MEVVLPDELLAKIVQDCVEPWTLTTLYQPYIGTFRFSGMPALTNIKLASKLFHEEIWRGIRNRYDGKIEIISVGDRARAMFPKLTRKIAWLLPLITSITINPMERAEAQELILTPNLSSLQLSDYTSHRFVTEEEVLLTSEFESFVRQRAKSVYLRIVKSQRVQLRERKVKVNVILRVRCVNRYTMWYKLTITEDENFVVTYRNKIID